jgi:hypothetical protein
LRELAAPPGLRRTSRQRLPDLAAPRPLSCPRRSHPTNHCQQALTSAARSKLGQAGPGGALAAGALLLALTARDAQAELSASLAAAVLCRQVLAQVRRERLAHVDYCDSAYSTM